MAKRYNVQVTLSSIEGRCPRGYEVGRSWLIGGTTPDGMCMGAYNSILPAIQIFRYGGQPPGTEDEDVTYISCPDPKGRLVFEVRRLRD